MNNVSQYEEDMKNQFRVNLYIQTEVNGVTRDVKVRVVAYQDFKLVQIDPSYTGTPKQKRLKLPKDTRIEWLERQAKAKKEAKLEIPKLLATQSGDINYSGESTKIRFVQAHASLIYYIKNPSKNVINAHEKAHNEKYEPAN